MSEGRGGGRLEARTVEVQCRRHGRRSARASPAEGDAERRHPAGRYAGFQPARVPRESLPARCRRSGRLEGGAPRVASCATSSRGVSGARTFVSTTRMLPRPSLFAVCHRMSADDEVLNAMRVQQYDELSQIGLQLRQEHSAAAPPVREEYSASPQEPAPHRTDRRLDPHLQNCETSALLDPRLRL